METVDGIDELAQRITMKLACPRGSFLPAPDFGSRLHLLHGIRPSERRSAAELYIAEALRGERDVELLEFEISGAGQNDINLSLIFGYKGERVQIKTIVGGMAN